MRVHFRSRVQSATLCPTILQRKQRSGLGCSPVSCAGVSLRAGGCGPNADTGPLAATAAGLAGCVRFGCAGCGGCACGCIRCAGGGAVISSRGVGAAKGLGTSRPGPSSLKKNFVPPTCLVHICLGKRLNISSGPLETERKTQPSYLCLRLTTLRQPAG